MKNVVVSAHTVAIDAYIIKGRLEAEGIPAYTQDDQYVTMDWMMSHAIGGVKVAVPESHYDQALKVLENTQNDTYLINQLDDADLSTELTNSYLPEQPLHCPNCQSANISRLDLLQHFSLIILFILHTPLAFTKQYYSCDDCDKVFTPDKDPVKRFMLIVTAVLSIILAMLVVFTSAIDDSYQYPNPGYYLSDSGDDMIILINDPSELSEEEWSDEASPHEEWLEETPPLED